MDSGYILYVEKHKFQLNSILFYSKNTFLPGCAQASSRPVANPQHLRAIGFELFDE
jgi:hypothetical protein